MIVYYRFQRRGAIQVQLVFPTLKINGGQQTHQPQIVVAVQVANKYMANFTMAQPVF